MTDRAGPPTPRNAPYGDTRYAVRDAAFEQWLRDPGALSTQAAFNAGWAARKLQDYREVLKIVPPCAEPLDKMVRPVSSLFPTEKEIDDAC